jgi:alpha-methylacyl-CoA racemase
MLREEPAMRAIEATVERRAAMRPSAPMGPAARPPARVTVSSGPTSARPLQGVRVLDLSRLLPGPYCSMLLADLGADVIKVETPRAGDYARMAPPELGFGEIFEALNRGKRSIAVDYRLPAGRDLVLRLAASADVFLESSRPGQLARRGLGEREVREANPSILHCSLSGFGQTGPYRDRPGHDIDYLAMGGLMSLLGDGERRPVPPGVQLADIAGATLAAMHILAALVRRGVTGEGASLDVAILDAVVGLLVPLGAGLASARAGHGSLAGSDPCYTTYRSRDGRWLAVGALEPTFWAAFCRGIGRQDLVARQFDPAARAEVDGVIAGRDASEWLAHFGPEACVVPVLTTAEAADDPHIRARGLVVDGGRAPRVVSPFASGGSHASERPAPGLGEHTREVLLDAGWSTEELGELEQAGVLGGTRSAAREARAARLGSLLARRGGVSTDDSPATAHPPSAPAIAYAGVAREMT